MRPGVGYHHQIGGNVPVSSWSVPESVPTFSENAVFPGKEATSSSPTGEMNYRLETGEKGLSEVAGSAESAAEAAEICRFDDNLDEVIEAWAGLSEPDREAVLRIVQESAERGKG